MLPPIDARLQVTISFYIILSLLLIAIIFVFWGFFRIRGYFKTYNDMKSTHDEYQKRNKTLEADIQIFQEKTRELKAAIQNLQEKNMTLEDATQRLREKNKQLEADAQNIQEKIKSLRVDNQRLREKNKGLDVDIQHLTEERASKPDDQNSSDKEMYQNFIYHISHEISNPLQSIQTSLDNMAGLTPQEKGQWEQYRSIITDEIRRLRELTTSLRLLSRLETAGVAIERELVNIRGVVESVILELDDLAAEKSVTLKMQCPLHPARVMVNRDQIRQVLINLVNNGIKYGPEKDGEVLIDVQDEGNCLCIRVFDNGMGIQEEDMPHIFDIAYRSPGAVFREKKGSGLGLSIVKRIITQHGGNIQVESTPGRGTTVTFDLPVSGIDVNQKQGKKK